jgi:DnaK suppressor protein
MDPDIASLAPVDRTLIHALRARLQAAPEAANARLLMQINLLLRGKNILIAMNILDENTLKPLRAWMLGRERELLAEIGAAREAAVAAAAATGIAATDVNDLEDQASKRERTTLQDAEVQRDYNELADVRAALARLNDGSYGTCIDCTQPIDLQRLVVMPAAARCMVCQTQFELHAIPPAMTIRS